MRVVALVSGGKDSCFNMMLCAKHGHEVVAVANLHPPEEEVQELDSYMFQTVGHNLIEAMGTQCMGLPVFRKKVTGSSKNVGRSYAATEGDEVEDLRQLLQLVLARVPGVEAVSCGAVRSDYQRVRVEQVCDSLGLISLAFMWRRHQEHLMQRMVGEGLHAVLIKVACLGLDPRRHLGKSLAQMFAKLKDLNALYGVHVCGEGGEYETLTLDCPLFKYGRIVLDATENAVDDRDDSGHLVVRAFHVEPKHGAEAGAGAEGPPASAQVIHFEDEVQDETAFRGAAAATSAEQGGEAQEVGFRQTVSYTESSRYKVIVGSIEKVDGDGDGGGDGAAAAMGAPVGAFRQLMQAMQARLEAEGRSLRHGVIVYFYLRDMSHFAALNKVYKSCFGTVNPPSRCCIEMALGAAEVLRIQVLVSGGVGLDEGRDIMHVQSISEWAPCCIGPYSQAAHFGDCLFVSGQLGLDPPKMQFTAKTVSEELAATLQVNQHAVSTLPPPSLALPLSLASPHSAGDVRLPENGRKKPSNDGK